MQYPKIHLNPEMTEYQKQRFAQYEAAYGTICIAFAVEFTEDLEKVMLEPSCKNALRGAVFAGSPQAFANIVELAEKFKDSYDEESADMTVGYAGALAERLAEYVNIYHQDASEINCSYLEGAIKFALLHDGFSATRCFSHAFGSDYASYKLEGRIPDQSLQKIFDFYEENLPQTRARRRGTPANAHLKSADEFLAALKGGTLDLAHLFSGGGGALGDLFKLMNLVGERVANSEEILQEIRKLGEDHGIKPLIEEVDRRLARLNAPVASVPPRVKPEKSPELLQWEIAKENLKNAFYSFLEMYQANPLGWGKPFAQNGWLRSGFDIFMTDISEKSFRERANLLFEGSFMAEVNIASIEGEEKRESLLNIFDFYERTTLSRAIEQFFAADDALGGYIAQKEADKKADDALGEYLAQKADKKKAQEIARMERARANSHIDDDSINLLQNMGQAINGQGQSSCKPIGQAEFLKHLINMQKVQPASPSPQQQQLEEALRGLAIPKAIKEQQQQANLSAARANVVNAFKNVVQMVQFLLDANRALPELVGRVAADLGISPNLVTIYYGCGDEKSRETFFREQFHYALASALELAGRTDDAKTVYLQKLGQLEGLQGYVRDYFAAKQFLQELEDQVSPVTLGAEEENALKCEYAHANSQKAWILQVIAKNIQNRLDANISTPSIARSLVSNFNVHPAAVDVYYGCTSKDSRERYFRNHIFSAISAYLHRVSKDEQKKTGCLALLHETEELQSLVLEYFEKERVFQEIQYKVNPVIEKAIAPDATARPRFSASPMVDAVLNQHLQDRQDIANLRGEMVGYYNPNAFSSVKRPVVPAMPQMAFHNVGGAVGGPKK